MQNICAWQTDYEPMRGIIAGAIIQTDPDQQRDNVVRRQ